jgi:hypothetical protein
VELKDIYPPTLEINTVIGQARFFLGDRWIKIGKIECIDTVENGKYFVEMQFPDIDLFMECRGDDGSYDWAEWGVRMN